MSEASRVSPDLLLLDSLNDFQTHAVNMVTQARRNIQILSSELDPHVYNTDELISALSQFARSNRAALIQILVKDTKPLIESGHKLARLSQRLSSKIQLRKLTLEPENKDMAFLLCDKEHLLYKNDDTVFKGFANYQAAVEIKRLREAFDYLWQYSETEPELQLLHL